MFISAVSVKCGSAWNRFVQNRTSPRDFGLSRPHLDLMSIVKSEASGLRAQTSRLALLNLLKPQTIWFVEDSQSLCHTDSVA